MTRQHPLDPARAFAFSEQTWEHSVVPVLLDYMRIPNKSPQFDPSWREHGHMERAVALYEAWAREHAPAGSKVEVIRLPDRTPLLYIDVPGTDGDPVLMYGHLDKQPEMTGWREGLGPWNPVREGDRLFGRGGADDGYAMFGALAALRMLADQGRSHRRCVVIIEACEESGSGDLPAYVEHLADRLGRPGLVVCLDSGCGNYDQMWCTTTLRGLVTCSLRVDVLNEGVHSGDASGIVADSTRVLRLLLDRIEDSATGRILLDELHTQIPPARTAEARAVASTLGTEVWDKFPLVDGMRPMVTDLTELVLARTWRPALTIVGADGLPSQADAGNVLRPQTSFKLSLRLPPRVDAERAVARLKQILEKDPPYGARVSVSEVEAAAGWEAPALAPWLSESLQAASQTFFGKPVMFMGEGGSIPFMGMLGARYPQAQFVITGVLGPGSNAHGPNEFLDLPTAKKLTCCIAQVVSDYSSR
jgi:acetylornithine deacetylase/succinyl-diaminopimelate desuccinylase-like protein